MPYIVSLSEGRPARFHEIPPGGATLGSKADNTIVVARSGISRHHARIAVIDGEHILEDLDSSTFTFVGETPVTRHVLADRTVFRLGDSAHFLFLLTHDPAVAEEVLSRREGGPIEAADDVIQRITSNEVRSLETLLEIGASLNSSLDPGVVLETILDKALALTGAERGFLMLLEDGELTPKVARNMEQESGEDGEVAFSRSFARKVIDRGETIISTNVAEDPRYKSASILAQNIFSILCAPLKVREETIGCLYVDTRRPEVVSSGEFSSFFTALANQAAVAIHNARLAEDLRQSQQFLKATNRELERRVKELDALYEVSASMNLDQALDAVLGLCLAKVRELFAAQSAALVLTEPGSGRFALKMMEGQPLDSLPDSIRQSHERIAELVAAGGRGTFSNDIRSDAILGSLAGDDRTVRSLLGSPLLARSAAIGVILVTNCPERSGFTSEDVSTLASLAAVAAVALEKNRVYRERVRQERLNQEMEDARKVQHLLLPKVVPHIPGYEFAARYAPANRVGGDYYDFIPVGSSRLAIVVADVSGHDIASAIIMAMGRNLIRTYLTLCESPAEVLTRTSRALREDIRSRFITMFLGILELESGVLTYSNAGNHPPLFLTRGSSEFAGLEEGGFPLGLIDGATYVEASIRVQSGDLLVAFTDGLIEAQGRGGELYETERLKDRILSLRSERVDDLVGAIQAGVLEYASTGKLDDDFTLVAVRSVPPASSLHFHFPSSFEGVSPQLERVLTYVESCAGRIERGRLETALKEAVSNAIEHGNDYDPARRVYVGVLRDSQGVIVTVEDEGDGFDPERLNAPGSTRRIRGTGLDLIRKSADQLSWNPSGNCIRMRFYMDPP